MRDAARVLRWASNAMESLEGQLLAGKYKVERVLGQGGMGVVVAAMHQQLEQRVALKFLVPTALSNEEAVGRFLREARSAVRLMSEHVARVIDVGTLDNGAPFIVMEYLEGRDLATVVAEQGPLPVKTAVEYVLQACEALAEAHAAGIIHRDLKPANLFLIHRRDGTPCVKVLDFGIAKVVSKATEATLAKTNGAMGTPYYMAPEQMRSARNADARSDIWSLGIILYELLTGSVAFPRETLPALCAAILSDPPPPLRELRPDVPARLESVVLNCLAKEPAERYQDVAELAAALSEFASDEARISVARVRKILASTDAAAARTSFGNLQATDANQPTVAAAPDPNREPTRKGRGWLALTVSALLIAVAASALWIARSTPESTESVTQPEPVATPEPTPAPPSPEPPADKPAPEVAPAANALPEPVAPVVAKPRPAAVRRPGSARTSPKAPAAPSPPAMGDYGDRK